MRRAIELAKRVAAGSHDAARELAAEGEVQQQQQASARVEADVQQQKKQLAGKSLSDASFNVQAKHAVLEALKKAGLIEDVNAPGAQRLTAEQAAAKKQAKMQMQTARSWRSWEACRCGS